MFGLGYQEALLLLVIAAPLVAIVVTIARARKRRAATGERVDAPKGIGGWLLIFAISLIAIPFFLLYRLVQESRALVQLGALLRPGNRYYSPWWGPVLVGETLYLLVALIATCWIAVLFFKRKATFPRSWLRVNVLVAALTTLDAIAVWAMWQQFPDLWKGEDIAQEFRTVFWGWIGVAIWASYLKDSDRVRNTFIQ